MHSEAMCPTACSPTFPVQKWEEANKDSYGKVLFVGEMVLHEYERADGTIAVHLPEDREELAQAEHQASVDQHNLLFDTYIAMEDLYHKRTPPGQKYHTLTGLFCPCIAPLFLELV